MKCSIKLSQKRFCLSRLTTPKHGSSSAWKVYSKTGNALVRPIEAKDGESRQDAILRAKKEYCVARQEHTAHHREMAKTMLASKINCLNSEYPRNSFSLKNPDVAKEFLATAFYHNAAAAKGLPVFDKDVFAASKKAALREFSV